MSVAGSVNVRVNGNTFHSSVIGFEITVSNEVQVTQNEIYNNCVGVGLFHHNGAGNPPLPVMENRVIEQNDIYNNNLSPTPASELTPIPFQGLLPPGIGVLAAGVSDHVIANNNVEDNDYVGISVLGWWTVMTTPTLNEAPEYGSDFSRGMWVEQGNGVRLFVSGTASLDESGETVYLDDFKGQAERMLFNVKSLPSEQGAGFDHVVSGSRGFRITCLKHPGDLPELQEVFRDAGYVGFPNVVVEAAVCRPELLVKTELLAVLRRSTAI